MALEPNQTNIKRLRDFSFNFMKYIIIIEQAMPLKHYYIYLFLCDNTGWILFSCLILPDTVRDAGPDPPGAGDGARVARAERETSVTGDLTAEPGLAQSETGEGAGLDGWLGGVTVRSAGEEEPGPPGQPA